MLSASEVSDGRRRETSGRRALPGDRVHNEPHDSKAFDCIVHARHFRIARRRQRDDTLLLRIHAARDNQ